ncbi:hypothetical protein MYG64_27870 (plasmid) [Ensifer adhaerens]|uniref:Uncharacterized protein n=1 Tax=Ensifer adhaerens TaxID=106592 RepID=A0A9Q8YEF2_ENSAD|nr:hypothetical protein [Ensifer adhaerens]USJ27403.1 hypothetical protein NE863_33675 [Ensifer adhaerens]UTV41009.1 hypothetical protein MYG64_27870 [Ensifer adhaerens]
MTTKISDLSLHPWLLQELKNFGFETAEDLKNVPSAELLRIPLLGGRVWRNICKAAGRELYDP